MRASSLSRRNATRWSRPFRSLSATGQLSARLLGLKVPYYDHVKHYKQVRDKWWGTDTKD